MRVLFLTNIPSPYRVRFFNELGKSCELTVLYQKSSSAERDSKWKSEEASTYRSVLLKGISTGVDKAFCPEVIKYLKDRKYEIIVICGIASPTEMIAIEWCKSHKRPYLLESDGGFAKNGKGLKEKLKSHLIKGARAYFSTGKEHDNYYRMYGANGPIVRYPFASFSKEDVLNSPVEISEKKQIREKLGIVERNVVLSVGRFSYQNGYGKGYDILMKAAERLSSDIGIYIVGDEPTEEFVNWKASKNLDNVHFVGFKVKNELAQYYRAADVFALMTRGDVWGLVVNEAMSFGLPVITTNKCIAGLEMVDHGVNGFILQVDDIDSLCEIVPKAFKLNCEEECLRTANKYTIEEMVIAHKRVFEAIDSY